jgi:hypothetical protein
MEATNHRITDTWLFARLIINSYKLIKSLLNIALYDTPKTYIYTPCSFKQFDIAPNLINRTCIKFPLHIKALFHI